MKENKTKIKIRKDKMFTKYKISDIVFLSIVSLITILSCGVMPLVVPLLHVIFGIAQLVTCFQISLFFTIGLNKVRKPGSLLIMTIIMGSIMLIMSFPMFVGFFISAIILEFLLLIFRSYKSNISIFLTGIFFPFLNLPFNYLTNYIIQNKAMMKTITRNIYLSIAIPIIILIISFIATLIGFLISSEINKISLRKNNYGWQN